MPRIITIKLAGRRRRRRWVSFTMDDFGRCGPGYAARSEQASIDLAAAGAAANH